MLEKHRTLRRADGHYTIISNDALRDSRLSYRARGVLAAALSHGTGFTLTRAWIDSHGTEGRDAITSAIAELRQLGYVQDSFGGGASPIQRRLTWTDHPVALESRATENPSDGKPVRLKTRPTENPSHSKKTNLQEDQLEENQLEEEPPYPRRAGEPPTKAQPVALAKPKDRAKSSTLPLDLLPPDLADCHDLIRDWWTVKAKGRSSVALQRACNMLRAYTPAERSEVLSTAIVGGHQGLYPPRSQSAPRPNGQNRMTKADWDALDHVAIF